MMKKYFIFLIVIISSTLLISQEVKAPNQVSIEYILGFERVGFYNYKEYSRYNGFSDGPYESIETIGKRGIEYSLGTRIAIKVNERNTLYSGFKLNAFQVKTNLTSGLWSWKVERKTKVFTYLKFEIGHRYSLFWSSKYDFFIENSFQYGYNSKIQKYKVEGKSLIWKSGVHVEKSISNKLNLFANVNYGIGLIDSSPTDHYTLGKNLIGIEFGIQQKL